MIRIYYNATGTIEYMISGGDIVSIDRPGAYLDLDAKINIDHWRVNTETLTLEPKQPTPAPVR